MLVLATSDEHIHTKYGSPGVSNFWGTLGSHTHTHTHTHFSKPFTVRGGSIKLISTVFMRFKKQVSNNKWSTRAYEFCKVWNLCIKLLSNKTFSLLPYMDMLLIIWLWDVIFISTTMYLTGNCSTMQNTLNLKLLHAALQCTQAPGIYHMMYSYLLLSVAEDGTL